MTDTRFNAQMQAYGRWKADVIEGVQRYRRWLEDNDMGSPEDELRLFEIIESLTSDRLTIAFVAEFARGKTELINAIFFSEYDRRLLPSEAGRTTMCPTEMFYDNEAEQAYIRLLPIETRLRETSIAEFKAQPIEWMTIPLELDNPGSMAEAFQEIVRVKHVNVEQARQLGLYHEDSRSAPDQVEVPMWRHALISFPHPLLKQGLVLLDTPGLNAIGSEPELTLSILPNAQAVVFILAADTGTTKSDLEMWQHHVKPLQSGKGKGLIVVLNKVDTLWDELKGEAGIEKTIREQCKRVAATLGVPAARVFPASAQKGLLAKIRNDRALLEKSNVLALENILATEILPQKQALVRDTVTTQAGEIIRESHDLLASRLQAVDEQLEELRGLSGKNNQVVEYLMTKSREEQVTYYKNVESFQANKRILGEQTTKLVELLSLSELDRLIADTRKSMTGSWTTHGLRSSMKTFFEETTARLNEVGEYTAQLNRLVLTVYRKFHAEHGLTEVKPNLFGVTRYVSEMQQLYREAEAYRNSPVTTMTEQNFIIRRFFISLVSRARNIFYEARRDAEQWGRNVMTPLVKQIKEHKQQMEKRLENLRKVNESRDTLSQRIEELEASQIQLDQQLKELKHILEVIKRPLTTDQETHPERALA